MNKLTKYIFTMTPPRWHFWNPWSGYIGGVLMLVVFFAASEALADAEYDKTDSGYMGYDYDTGEFTEVSEDPSGGYDTYNYDTHEYGRIEGNESGGFTVYSDDE